MSFIEQISLNYLSPLFGTANGTNGAEAAEGDEVALNNNTAADNRHLIQGHISLGSPL